MGVVRNLTVSLPEDVIDKLRVLAAEQKTSVNRFVGTVLRNVVGESGSDWREDHQALLDEIGSRPRSGKWSREEVYAERLK
jgi:hypothetical protein